MSISREVGTYDLEGKGYRRSSQASQGLGSGVGLNKPNTVTADDVCGGALLLRGGIIDALFRHFF